MTAPWGLVAASLALWGVSVGAPWLGIGLGIAFEALRMTSASSRAAARIALVARVCAILTFAALVYVVSTQSLPHSLYNWLRWLPLFLLPLPSMQLLAGGVPLSALIGALRPKAEAPDDDRPVDLTHAYAGLTLAAAGTGSGAQAWLYAGFAVIVAWALLARMPRGRRALGVAMVMIAAALGFGIHLGISALQGQVEEWSTELLQDLMSAKPDPFRERTRIGDLGKIKLNDRIVMRVATDGPRPGALLLRESTFDRYHGGEWRSARRAARPLPKDGDRWIVSGGEAARSLWVRRSLPGGEGLLALPQGTRVVTNLPAHSMESFPSGAVHARGTPRFLAFGVAYDESAERDAPNAATDLEVPEVLAGVLERVLTDERLRQGPPAATLEGVRAFFEAKFSYSLDLGEARGRTLGDFLLRDRKGHCEYFATATVLLLRQAGIPARYVGGFSAQEYSTLEKAFVVRNRHAHAWAMAYVDGRWVSVDTTPARWAEFEAEAARSFFAPLLDRVSWLVDRVVQAWLHHSAEDLMGAMTMALVALLLAPAVLLLVRKLRRRAASRPRSAADAVAVAWRMVEKRVARIGHARPAGETVRAWTSRMLKESPEEPWRERLFKLARDYYRVRFDPAAKTDSVLEFVDAARRFKGSGYLGSRLPPK